MVCSLCGSKKLEVIYSETLDKSLTSSGRIVSHKTNVFFCDNCCHVQSSVLDNLDDFYKEHYKVSQEKLLFKSDYEAELILKKVQLQEKSSILDFGAAKGLTIKKVGKALNVSPFVFDITETYEDVWKDSFEEGHYASMQCPESWHNKFDLVTCSFVLEHVPCPFVLLKDIRKLLKDDGILYLQVPNFYDNIIDLFLSDHVHHYTEGALKFLMEVSGFSILEVDSQSRIGAYVLTAKKGSVAPQKVDFQCDASEVNKKRQEAVSCVKRFRDALDRFKTLSEKSDNLGIFGAGLYGNYLCYDLRPKNLSFFIDTNPHFVEMFGLPCYTPDNIPEKFRKSQVALAVNPLKGDALMSKYKHTINMKKIFI